MKKHKTATETMMEESEKIRKSWMVSFDERLTKIEYHLNLTGTADPHKCFVCGEPADMGFGNALGPQRGYCRKHMPETAGEYQGPKHEVIPPMQMDYAGTAEESERCKKCGRTSEIVKLAQACPFCTPDLPLNVKVAKALGHRFYWQNCIYNADKHRELTPLTNYDTSLVAAMGALEEYCRKNELYYRITNSIHFQVVIEFKKAAFTENIDAGWNIGKALMGNTEEFIRTICLAIVAHSEGK